MEASISNTKEALMGLYKLEAQVYQDLEILDYPKRDWVIPQASRNGNHIYDVLIVGAGQGGQTVAFALQREKITNILLIDQNPENQEGPWRTFARMPNLRTPKYVLGPDLSIPNLSIRAWYEAQYGADEWASLKFIPKEAWADYLYWYRQVLNLPVLNDTRAKDIAWDDENQCFKVTVASPLNTERCYLAQKVVLATGIEGSGQWQVPTMVKNHLSPNLYAHTCQPIDFESLQGKTVAVLGAGASAFDNASLALECGANRVDLYFRRAKLPNINPYRWAEFVGFLKHQGDLSDAQRWRMISKILKMGQLPPTDTYQRACQHSNFYLHPGEPWDNVEEVNGKVRVTTAKGTQDFDYVIVAAGFTTDLSLRPELAKLYPNIALWSDRFTPPDGEHHADLSRHPYLGANFEFQEKVPGSAPYLKGLFNFTFGSLASLGFGGASISGMKYSVPRLVQGITRQLYTDHFEDYYASLCNWDLEEFEVGTVNA